MCLGQNKVRCYYCGFLSLRSMQTRGLDEAEQDYRKTGEPQRIPADDKYKDIHESWPICFIIKYNLTSECKDISSTGPNASIILQVISKERNCKSFIKYQQGYSPKEHQEMIDKDKQKKWLARQQWFIVLVAGIFTIIGSIIGVVIANLFS